MDMKRLRYSLASAALAGLALAAPDLHGQRITVELGPSAALPTDELAGTHLEGGAGFGGTVAVRALEHLSLYGGWDWLHFRADRSFAGDDRDFEETGYTFGLRFEHPYRASDRMIRLEGGGTYKHVEIENNRGDVIENSGHSLGFELGAGMVLPLRGAWRTAPMLRFRSLAPDFDLDGTTVAGDLRYGSVEVGVSRQF
jgi:hypothetical protein